MVRAKGIAEIAWKQQRAYQIGKSHQEYQIANRVIYAQSTLK